MTPDPNIAHYYRVKYTGPELEAALAALEKYPTFIGDCRIKKAQQEGKRQEHIKRLLHDTSK